MSMRSEKGFTLLEILIALFIFALLSAIMASAMHSIFSSQERTELHSQQFDALQKAMLIFTRDIQQIVDRPITNATGGNEPALVGTTSTITFTHGGLINPFGIVNRSTLQRTRYQLNQTIFTRISWNALDQVQKTISTERSLFSPVTDLRFEYIDAKNQRQNSWPPPDQPQAGLPIGVRIILTLRDWGTLTQLYVITGTSLATQK